MEMFRIRKSSSRDSSPLGKAVTSFGLSSREKLVLVDRSHKGCGEARIEYTIIKSGSNSNSRSTSISTEDNLPTQQLGHHTSGLLTGTVMKKLLADEISMDTESRRKPSVVARLMGLDGFLPPQQDANKQNKKTHDDYCLKTASTACHRYANPNESQLDMRISVEQKQFKNIHEVAESSKVHGESSPIHVYSSRKNGQDEMAFVREKFMDVKKISTYERLLDTKEFNDALEVLDSNKDLLLKFLDDTDSIFVKRLHVDRNYHSVHDRDTESSVLKHNINAIGCQSGREASEKIDISFSHEYRGGLHDYSSCKHEKNAQELSHFPAERKDSSVPTNIVVLKPNMAKLQSSSKHTSSCEFLSDFGACKKKDDKNGDIKFWGKTSLPHSFDKSEIYCRESRRLAREITRQMKQELGKESFKVSQNRYRGYYADESSLDISENDSSYESESNNESTKMPLHWGHHGEAPCSRYSESSMNREAKKRLSERCNKTGGSHESELVGKDGKLGKMLAVPELEVSLSNVEARSAYDGSCRYRWRGGMTGSTTSSGISSKDGWKDQPFARLSRSRSLFASDYACSPRTSLGHEDFVIENFLVSKEHMSHSESKAIRRSISVRTSNMMPGPVYHQNRRVSEATEFQSDMNEKDSTFGDKNSPDVKAVISETPNLINCEVVGLEPESFPESLISTDEQEFRVDMLVLNGSCSTDLHESMTKEASKWCEMEDTASVECPASEMEWHVTLKDGNQPSPNSPLEATFTDLSSGSECFERVHAELHGLRMQLQLLKLESQACDGPMVITRDNDVAEGSSVPSEERGLLNYEGSWVSSYFLDVLAELGLDGIDPKMLRPAWGSVGYLIAPWIFEILEKKYCRLETCSRVERRFLFDRINSAVTEVMEQVTDPHPWVNIGKKAVCSHYHKDGFEGKVWELLKQQEAEEIWNGFYQVLESDLRWMDLGDEIDGVCREIEKQLIDEQVVEFMTM